MKRPSLEWMPASPCGPVALVLTYFISALVTLGAVTLTNPSFEQPVQASGGYAYNSPGWVDNGAANHTSRFVEYIAGFSAEGNQHLGLLAGWAVWQDLPDTYQPNTVYRLRVAVGNRATFTQVGNGSTYSLTDPSGVASFNGTFNASTIPVGTFADAPALEVNTAVNPALVGKPIRIRLSAGGTGRSHFDQVRLEAATAFTVLNHYRLGDDDPGAVNGCCPGTTRDSVGGRHLTVSGGPFWSSDVATAAKTKGGSGLAFWFFQGGPYAADAAVLTTVTDDFGIEAWVKPGTTNGNHSIVFNGDTGANGWGLYQFGDTFRGFFGGVNVVGSGPIKVGVWTHLALVRAGGTARLYVNGVAAGSASTVVPITPAGGFAIGSAPQNLGLETLPGYVDEVRLFTFSAGQFSTNLLLINGALLPPAMTAAAASGVSETGATLASSVHPRGQPVKAWFQYGLTTNYGSVTPSNNVAAGNALVVFSQSITGLTAGALYHFRAAALSAGGVTYSDDATFTTVAAAPSDGSTITLAQLLAQGFTNGPLTGYALNVTGIRDAPGAFFSDIRPEPTEGNMVQAHGGGVRLFGLNATVTSAFVQDGKLLFKGFLSLPPPLNRFESMVANGLGWHVNASGAIHFGSGTGPGGTLPIPGKFRFGVLSVGGLSLTINPGTKTYGGSALLGLGDGPSGSYCPGFTPGPALFGGGVLVVDGKLDELSLQAVDLRKPLGTTGTFLDSIIGKVGNLALNGGEDWFIQGEAVINAGCPVLTKYPMTMRARATVNSAGYFDVVGSSEVFGVPTSKAYLRYNPPYTVAAGASVNYQDIFLADCSFQLTSGPQFSGSAGGKLQVPRYVPVAGGFTFADARASFNNAGFRGSVTFNVTPEIPSVCTPGYCPPRVCIPYWCPTWRNPRRTCKKCWSPTCIPEICTPRVPAVSATFSFKFEGGSFTFAAADPLVEPWEKSFQQAVVEPATGNRVSFMGNWSRVDKCSTGPCGRRFAPTPAPVDGFQAAEAPPAAVFELPSGEESVMFRLTWENPENHLVFMTVTPETGEPLGVSTDEVSAQTSILRAFPQYPGAYLIIDGQRREAIIGLPKPAAGVYQVTLGQTASLGNHAVELLRQNRAPEVSVDSISDRETPGIYVVNYTTVIPRGEPSTRIMLSQATSDPSARYGPAHQSKAGGVYLVHTTFSSNGSHDYVLDTRALEVPDGDYFVVVNVDDPNSLEVEAFSKQRVTVRNVAAPAPVPTFAVRGDNGGFSVRWEPSPSSNVLRYVVAYTQSSQAHDFEFNQAFDASQRIATITNLNNGQPYLVTIFVMGTNGLQSCAAEIQRVIPTEGFGLNPPLIVSRPRKAATVGQRYVYFPEVFDADDVLRPPAPLPEGEEDPSPDEIQDGQGRQWSLVTAPAGMTIDANGIIQWTPGADQVGDHAVTVRVTDLSSLPPHQDTNSLVRPRWGDQSYTVIVVGPENPTMAEPNHYRFLGAPPATAYAGEEYRYVPAVLFPTNRFTLTVEDGPPGLSVVQEGAEPDVTNVVRWSVPPNAVGHRVVLKAVPDLGAALTANDVVVQEFFLAVSAPHKELPQPTLITEATPTPEGFGVRWVGNAAAYQLQRATDLPAGPSFHLDFNTPLPVEAGLHGSAFLDESVGALQLNRDTTDQTGALIIGDFASGQTVYGFEAGFRIQITPSTTPPADGFSFNWATDLPDGTWGGAEEGAGSGLTVSFDTFDNGSGEAPAIDVKWNGAIVAHRSVGLAQLINATNYADVRIALHADATLDLDYAGQSIFSRQPVPGARPLAGARFGFGARTGGLAAAHTLDDLSLQLRLTPEASVWRTVHATQPGAAVNFQVDTNAPSARAFYRVLALP